MRQNISSGSPFERAIGLSRAVRVGPMVCVAGTAPLSAEGQTMYTGDVYSQTRRCLEITAKALRDAGADLANVVRTRVMLVDMAGWQEAARAHGEVFGEIRPACTFVEVSRFIDPEWLVETEADAYLG